MLKKNLIANLFTVKHLQKTKIKPDGHEATENHNKKIPRAGSDYTCLAVIKINAVLKIDENCYSQVFFL